MKRGLGEGWAARGVRIINKVFLLGRLTRDPEISTAQSGLMITKFTLAIDRFTKDANGKNEADFIQIVAFKTLAENCGNSLTKGQRALVEGRLQIRSFEGKDGGKKWVTEIIAQSVQFMDRKAPESPPREATPGDAASQFGADVANYATDDPEIPF